MRPRARRLAAVLFALALVTAAALWWIFSGEQDNRVTAYFSRTVGVYPGSDVRVLGVRVGAVESVTPLGDRVRVVLTVDRGAPVSAETGAVIVAPSVVADRYVQLTTLSRGGPRLAGGAVIPVTRTATPVELDQLYSSLNDLVTALGPNGANAGGALSELLDVGAANLSGNGAAVNESVTNLAKLARTLAGSKDDLFGTVDELSKFTGMLAGNDRQVARVNQQLAELLRTLAGNRDELSGALRTLGGALADIQGFVRDNRAAIKSNVDKLARTTQTLVDRRAELAETLDVAPLAVTNVLGAFDPESGTLQGRSNLLEFLPYLPLPVAGQPYVGGSR